MTDDRLSSGMTATEAAMRAEAWWDRKGRHLIRPAFNQARGANKVGKGFVVEGEVVDVLPSGILKGLSWSFLSRDEKLRIVKWWHHWHVLAVDVEDPKVSKEDRDMFRRLGIQ